MKLHLYTLLILFGCSLVQLQAQENTNQNKFRQLSQELPTPNIYRTASGAPGHAYWQQKADYKMNITLDDDTQRIYGEETVTYHNNAPDPLDYLWLQLDQNMRAKDSDTYKIQTNELDDRLSTGQLQRFFQDFDGGFKISYVKDADNKNLPYTINKTMMRIDLPKTLKNGESVTFKIKWWYNINDRMKIGGRSGMEYFTKNDNYLYTIAQFFPRMCVYSDVEGWQHKQFLGRGEFALAFGDYEVDITVPADHYVSATGTLENEDDVLSKTERNRLAKARKSFKEPVMIVTPSEAAANEKGKTTKTKTWKFKAANVRDFAFASSRKFIWDAMAVKQSDGSEVMAMSMYPKEGNPLWEKYSTKVVAHTLKWYSHYTFDYPYPVAWSIHTNRIGMEYPMICFNGGRPEPDGTYSERTKYGMIGVIIHEVGHNYFPMIVNSDERQWTWMDEGLNTFLQYLTEQQWERDYPSRRGPANKITGYMKGDKSRISPIMTNSESIWQFGANAYGKPATALNILRETIMGRELFDFAFKEYSRRWEFKHPTPADLFRTMEDASGVDLDWFWRGWFYTNDHVDMAIKSVKWYQPSTQNPDKELAWQKANDEAAPRNISDIRNEKIEITQDEIDPSLRDFYTEYNPYKSTILDQQEYEKYRSSLSEEERQLLDAEKHYYQITFENIGGLVMPLIIEFRFKDGTNEIRHIPAEIWKLRHDEVTKVFVVNKEAERIVLDPFIETADTDTDNNYFPRIQTMNRFEVYKSRSRSSRENEMQRAKRAEEAQSNKASGTN
jgi:hypothetical protein